MERKIGEIFKYKGEWYQCVEGDCTNCAFYIDNCDDCSLQEIIGNCCIKERADRYSVIFKKLEKVGEPYMAHDHSRNKDVVVQDYKLYNQHACYNGHEEMLVFGLNGRVGMVTIKSKEPIKSLNCENSVEIEIKQTKEDMEEKNLKPFDLQKAKDGKPVCTRDGRKARIICFDYNGSSKVYPIVALVEYENGSGQTYEQVCKYMENGRYKSFHGMETESEDDLMMLPEKKEGWVNVYNSLGVVTFSHNPYDTKKEALADAKPKYYVDTVKINWEE